MSMIISITDRAQAEELVSRAFGENHHLDVFLGNMSAEEFTQSRRGKVGGSDMGTMFGATKNSWVSNRDGKYECKPHTNYAVYGKYILEKKVYRPRIDLMRRLRYPDQWLDPEVDEGTREIWRNGHMNEPKIAALYAEQHPDDTVYEFPWRVICDDIPDGIKDIDYLCKTKDDEFYVLECKNPQMWSTQKGWQIMAQKGNTDDLAYLVDETYRMQVWFYISRTNMKYGVIVAGGWSLHEIAYTRLNRLPEKAEDKMIDSINHLVPILKHPGKRITDIDFPYKDKLLEYYNKTYKAIPLSPVEVDLPEDCNAKVEALIQAQEQLEKEKKEFSEKIKEISKDYNIKPKSITWNGPLQDRITALQTGIADAMTNHSYASATLSNGSKVRVTYDYSTTSKFDKEAFKKSEPELYNKFLKTKKEGRKLAVK